MVDVNAYKTKEDFISQIYYLRDKLIEFDPDVIIFPLVSAYPISDLLHIIDPGFNRQTVEYMPSSSIIEQSSKVIYTWMTNFLREYYDGSEIKIASIEEAISGASVLRVAKQIKKAINKIMAEYELNGIGNEGIFFKFFIIEDSRNLDSQQVSYLKLKNKLQSTNSVEVIPVKANLVMDLPRGMNPIIFKKGEKHHLPYVESVNYKREYFELLKSLTEIVGINISYVPPSPIYKVFESERFLI